MTIAPNAKIAAVRPMPDFETGSEACASNLAIIDDELFQAI